MTQFWYAFICQLNANHWLLEDLLFCIDCIAHVHREIQLFCMPNSCHHNYLQTFCISKTATFQHLNFICKTFQIRCNWPVNFHSNFKSTLTVHAALFASDYLLLVAAFRLCKSIFCRPIRILIFVRANFRTPLTLNKKYVNESATRGLAQNRPTLDVCRSVLWSKCREILALLVTFVFEKFPINFEFKTASCIYFGLTVEKFVVYNTVIDGNSNPTCRSRSVNRCVNFCFWQRLLLRAYLRQVFSGPSLVACLYFQFEFQLLNKLQQTVFGELTPPPTLFTFLSLNKHYCKSTIFTFSLLPIKSKR